MVKSHPDSTVATHSYAIVKIPIESLELLKVKRYYRPHSARLVFDCKSGGTGSIQRSLTVVSYDEAIRTHLLVAVKTYFGL